MGACRDSDIIIPETIGGYKVTGIAPNAFHNYEKITSVIIPDSVTSIGHHAFSGCKNLSTAIIGESVTDIGDYAFYRCAKLANVRFGESLKTIGTYAFYECSALAGLSLPNSVTTVKGLAFGFCNKLARVVLGESVKTIGASAFRGCQSLLRINIPGSVQDIGARAFSGNIEEFRVSNGNSVYTSVEGHLCSKDKSTLIQYASASKEESFMLPDSIVNIEAEAFIDCRHLTCIHLHPAVKYIGPRAFKNCTNLYILCYQDKKNKWKKVSLHDEWKNDSAIISIECDNGSVKLK